MDNGYFDLKKGSAGKAGASGLWAGVGWLVLVSESCCEGADLDEVVGEDAVSAPGSGAVDAGEFGAVPAVASFDVVDPSFGSGPPFDFLAEGSPVFEFAAGRDGFGCSADP